MKIIPPFFRQQFNDVFSRGSGNLLKGTFAMTLGMGLRSVLQVAVFLIVARELGVEGYGAFAAVLAIAGTLGCLCGFGAQIVLVRDVARDSNCFSEAWGRVLALIAISAPMLFCLYALVAWVVLPSSISWVSISFIGLADLLFLPVVQACSNAYQGFERISRSAHLVLAPVVFRLGGALVLPLIGMFVPQDLMLPAWAMIYALASFVAVLYSLRLVKHDLGDSIRVNTKCLFNGLRESIAFAFGASGQKLYADIDKTMLARMSNLESAGGYSAGYRLVDLARVPLVALLTSVLPRFYKIGAKDSKDIFHYGLHIIPFPLLYTVIIGGVIYVSAPLVTIVLGASYHSAISVLQWLAWLPLISLPRLLIQHMLIGVDFQVFVFRVLGLGAIINISLNYLMIPIWNWQGAIISTYLVEVIMTFILLIFGLINAKNKLISVG